MEQDHSYRQRQTKSGTNLSVSQRVKLRVKSGSPGQRFQKNRVARAVRSPKGQAEKSEPSQEARCFFQRTQRTSDKCSGVLPRIFIMTLISAGGFNALVFFIKPPQGPEACLSDLLRLKSCGVDFEVKGFCAENLEEKIHKRNSVRLVIRKIQFAPVNTGPAPKSETTRQFMMSDKPLHLEASLDKEIYYHGDPIGVNVNINNTTNKIVKKIKISVEQITDVVLYSLDKYTKIVCSEEFVENVAANSTFSKSYTVTPTLSNNREKRGLALDGKLKHEDTNLASTTVLRPGMDKEVLGILVSYKVKVNLMVSRGGILGDLTSSDVGVEMAVILMHPKPADTTPSAEDIVIEEFARQKLKGEKDDDEEKEEEDKAES